MPEFAPIEKYFSILKKSVLKKKIGKKMSWQSVKAEDILKECIQEIQEKTIRKLWYTFTHELRDAIEILIKIN